MSTAAIVLAAGLSRRMAPRNKLLVPDLTGTAMVARVVDSVLASRAQPVVVVVGHQAPLVRTALGEREVAIVEAADYATGLAASLRAGLATLPPSVTAALVCLGDMPLVGPSVIDRLIGAHDPARNQLIVVPTVDGQRGNPILWDRRFFAEMMTLLGDTGARALLAKYASSVAEVVCTGNAVLTDFDTPESLTISAA